MRSIALIGALALAAAPLAAQGAKFRTDVTPTPQNPGSVLWSVLGQGQQQQPTSRKSNHNPPGQMPPAGMCRIWIDGVPPGQQPAPTDCQTAVATKPANARVIWGDQNAFPGQGKGKFDKNKAKHRDGDDGNDDGDENDNRVESRTGRSGILGSIIPSTTSQQSIARKSKGKGKGRD